MFVRPLFFIATCIFLSVSIHSCSPENTDGSGTKDEAKTEVTAPAPTTEVKKQEEENPASTAQVVETSEAPEMSEEKNEEVVTPVLTKLEKNLQFIREKYAIITSSTTYKTVSFSAKCEVGESEFKRKTNGKGEVVFTESVSCGDHGCRTTAHYFWDNKLIFIFIKDSFFAGRSDYLREYRTYVKNGAMIQCLEKDVKSDEGYEKVIELASHTPNKKVTCAPEEMTEDIEQLKTLTQATANSYFCDY